MPCGRPQENPFCRYNLNLAQIRIATTCCETQASSMQKDYLPFQICQQSFPHDISQSFVGIFTCSLFRGIPRSASPRVNASPNFDPNKFDSPANFWREVYSRDCQASRRPLLYFAILEFFQCCGAIDLQCHSGWRESLASFARVSQGLVAWQVNHCNEVCE